MNTYNEVTEALAQKIGLDDPTKIRLTAHNQYSDGPRPNPIKYQSYEKLSDMLVQGYQAPTDTLYYEILDIPLFELEKLKSLKKEIARVGSEQDDGRDAAARAGTMERKAAAFKKKNDVLLELLGEKTEELEDAQSDLAELKKISRTELERSMK